MDAKTEFVELINKFESQCGPMDICDDNRTRIGIIGYNSPIELLLAAGLLPSYIEPLEDYSRDADPYFQTFACCNSRQILGHVVKGDYNCFHKFIFVHGCDSIRNLAGIWQLLFPEKILTYFRYPNNPSSNYAHKYLKEECSRLKEILERTTSTIINEENLYQSLVLLNEIKSTILTIVEYFNQLSFFTFLDLYTVYRSVMWNTCNENLLLLKRLNKLLDVAIQDNQGKDSLRSKPGKPVMISGIRLEPWLISVIEKSGLSIVGDDLFWGRRWFSKPVNINSQISPLDNIVTNLIKSIPEPYRHDPLKQRMAAIEGQMSRHKALGLLYIIHKYCDSSGFEFPVIQKHLTDLGFNTFLIELDSVNPVGQEQLVNRLSAFAEMIG